MYILVHCLRKHSKGFHIEPKLPVKRIVKLTFSKCLMIHLYHVRNMRALPRNINFLQGFCSGLIPTHYIGGKVRSPKTLKIIDLTLRFVMPFCQVLSRKSHMCRNLSYSFFYLLLWLWYCTHDSCFWGIINTFMM